MAGRTRGRSGASGCEGGEGGIARRLDLGDDGHRALGVDRGDPDDDRGEGAEAAQDRAQPQSLDRGRDGGGGQRVGGAVGALRK